MVWDGLLARPIASEGMALGEAIEPLLGAERDDMDAACLHRRREFAAGRSCARKALLQLGCPSVALPTGSDRLPQWPVGYIGSISHSRDYCWAAVAGSEFHASLGIDVERIDAVELDLAEEICTAEELRWLERLPNSTQQSKLAIIFSAKEALYKAQYPLTRSLFGFDVIQISVQVESGTFSGRFREDVPPFQRGTVLSGRFNLSEYHVATALTIPRASPAPDV